jgi:hypothetical protein
MIQGMEKSGDEQFISRKPQGENDTYHLRSIEYLGYVERDKEKFFIASVGFIRSSPFGQDTPVARGHSFMVVFRPDFTIAASSRAEISGYHISGNRLMSGEKVVVDFDSRDVSVRHHGYAMLEGLPYFFSDRITDKQWEDDEFIKREAEAEGARKREAEAKKAEKR